MVYGLLRTADVDVEGICDNSAERTHVEALARPEESDAYLFDRPVHMWPVATSSLAMPFI